MNGKSQEERLAMRVGILVPFELLQSEEQKGLHAFGEELGAKEAIAFGEGPDTAAMEEVPGTGVAEALELEVGMQLALAVDRANTRALQLQKEEAVGSTEEFYGLDHGPLGSQRQQ